MSISSINWEKCEDNTEGNQKPFQSKKDRQKNGQKIKDQRTNNDLQNTTQKTKDWVMQTPLKRGMNSGAPEGP